MPKCVRMFTCINVSIHCVIDVRTVCEWIRKKENNYIRLYRKISVMQVDITSNLRC